MWDLPGPGLEPLSPALAGGFLTTAPPGKSQQLCFKFSLLIYAKSSLKRKGGREGRREAGRKGGREGGREGGRKKTI